MAESWMMRARKYVTSGGCPESMPATVRPPVNVANQADLKRPAHTRTGTCYNPSIQHRQLMERADSDFLEISGVPTIHC